MGEKRAYKPRKPGGGRKKLKPEYDAGKNLKEQMESAVALYDSEMSLQAIGEELGLNPIKVRKLLITAGIYESDVAEMVQHTFNNYRETQGYKDAVLSTASAQVVQSLRHIVSAYEKVCTFPSTAEKGKISVGAERQRRYRAVRKLRTEPTEEHLWEVFCFILECGSKPTPVYPLPMKYERAGMGNIQKSFGSTAGRTVKAWPGVRYCWH